MSFISLLSFTNDKVKLMSHLQYKKKAHILVNKNVNKSNTISSQCTLLREREDIGISLIVIKDISLKKNENIDQTMKTQYVMDYMVSILV